MPVTAPHIKVLFRYTYLGQKCQNVQWFRPVGAAFLTATMDGVLEALWANMEADLRQITPASLTLASWDSLLGEELGGGGSFAEYPVPDAERVGTRAGGADSDLIPSFNAGGFRQTVGTRATRPGQKRFPFLMESDVSNNELGATYKSFLEAIAIRFSNPVVLGTPVATGVLQPEVGGTEVSGVPTVFQDITGFVINPDVTSQISRKKGRGA